MTDSNTANPGKELSIQRLYLKDLSFETPGAPHVFKLQWQPEMSLEIQNTHQILDAGILESTVHATVTVSHDKKPVFVVDLKYAGIFSYGGFNDAEIDALSGMVCPSIIFPYLREVVTDVATRGTFPQLILMPVNFEMLYQQQLQQKAKDKQ